VLATQRTNQHDGRLRSLILPLTCK